MSSISVAIAGLGHVGGGLARLIDEQGSARLPQAIEIVAVSARSRQKDRGVDVSSVDWYDDPVEMARSADYDVYVELIGGADGPAKAAVEAALARQRSVVTANKAMIAEHGADLARLARDNGVQILFEAAVAGAVPVVRVLKESLAGVSVDRVTGILNGTCNYLLTEMLAAGRDYEDVLADAQRLGYAEADPFLDVSGTDAAHKIAILSAIAFSADIDFSAVRIEGVDGLALEDLQLAGKLGFTIKLIAEGRVDDGKVFCSVAPRALEQNHPLASISGSLNTVRLEAPSFSQIVLTGPGAGAGPTASAVIGDIGRIGLAESADAFGRAPHHTTRQFAEPQGERQGRWFVRVHLSDRPGALAALSEAIAEASVSVDKLIQDSSVEGRSPIALTTHPCTGQQAEVMIAGIAALEESVDAPRLIRIEGGTS